MEKYTQLGAAGRMLCLSAVLVSSVCVAASDADFVFFNYEDGSPSDYTVSQHLVLDPANPLNPYTPFFGPIYYFNNQTWLASKFVPQTSGTLTTVTLEVRPSQGNVTVSSPQQMTVLLCPQTGNNAEGLSDFMSCDIFSTDAETFSSTSEYTTVVFKNPQGFISNGKLTAGTPAWIVVSPGDGNFRPLLPMGERLDVRMVPAMDSVQRASVLDGYYYSFDALSYPWVNMELKPIPFNNTAENISIKMKGQGVPDIEGACGIANGQKLKVAPSGNPQLCLVGNAGSVTNNAAGEFVWVCEGSGAGQDAQCQSWNGKSPNSPLALSYKKLIYKTKVKFQLKTQGGQGTGLVSYTTQNENGAQCQIKEQRVSKKIVNYYLKTGPGKGTCSVLATKAADGQNPASSAVPITFIIR